jgi:hypothetical protein
LLIYGCLLSDDDLTTIDCPDYLYMHSLLSGKITAFTYNIQYGTPYLFVVTADEPNIVQEYSTYGYPTYLKYDFKEPVDYIIV